MLISDWIAWYIAGSVVFNLFLGIIWRTSDWFNTFLKVLFFIFVGVGSYIIFNFQLLVSG